MIGVKFYVRAPRHPIKGSPFVQNLPSVICIGRWISIYYPAIDEWFDIIGVKPEMKALEMGFMEIKQVSLRTYLKMTGKPGAKRAVNSLLGRHLFNMTPQGEIEEGADREYTNTDDFFAEGPGGLGDLKPPVIFGGIVTGDENG